MDLPPLSTRSRRILADAADEARRRGHFYLAVEHLFSGIARGGAAPLARAMQNTGIEVNRFWSGMLEEMPTFSTRPWGDEVIITPRCQEVLRVALGLAARRGSTEVEEVHILEAILFEGQSVPMRHLRAAGISVADLSQAIVPAPPRRRGGPTPALDRFGRDLTARARMGTLSPMLGRDAELERLAQVLLRRNKNNPVLVGEAGVGKTAIVEGLAQRLASSRCPPPLEGSRVIELSLAALTSGTRLRGDFEERMVEVIAEASRTSGVILFLDEIHTLVGSGASMGALDGSSILKPALARGELRCIGATTIEEYRRHIEQDAALERRFERILVEEPSPENARQMLQGAAAALQAFHDVHVTPEAIEAAIEMTMRYVPQRRLPDKALDALDQSCSRVRLNAPSSETGRGGLAVGAEDVARTLAQWTGIPLERVAAKEARYLLELEESLQRRLVGQDHAVEAVCRAVIAARAGMSDPRRPSGVFLFLGPTGVGKTELARGLAEVLFGDEKKLIRFDMSEFTEPHTVSRLTGAPPGYVGYENEGELIAAARTHPSCVLLFDEVEKAHPHVFDLFLQMFDEGRITGSRGVTADLRHAVIVLTSNLDPRPVREARIGFREEEDAPPSFDARTLLGGWFRAELLNRIDEVVVFRHLNAADLRWILDRQVQQIEALAAARGVRLLVDDAGREWLIEMSDPGRFGARELRRVVDRQLRQPLAKLMLERGDAGGTIRATVDAGALRFRSE